MYYGIGSKLSNKLSKISPHFSFGFGFGFFGVCSHIILNNSSLFLLGFSCSCGCTWGRVKKIVLKVIAY